MRIVAVGWSQCAIAVALMASALEIAIIATLVHSALAAQNCPYLPSTTYFSIRFSLKPWSLLNP